MNDNDIIGAVHERQYKSYDIDLYQWADEKPHGISGVIRLRNDTEFVKAAVESHLPFLDETILVVQPSDDDTAEVAKKIVKDNPNDYIRIVDYPFIPCWIDTKPFYEMPVNSVYHIVNMTNYAISRAQYSWIAKIEGDVFCLPTFKIIRDLVDQRPKVSHYYGRVLLNLAGEFDQFPAVAPRNAGWDVGVFPNHPSWHCIRGGKWEMINFGEKPSQRSCEGWSGFHLKECKSRFLDNREWHERRQWTPLEPGLLAKALYEYNKIHPYIAPDNPLGEPVLFNQYKIDRRIQ